MTCKLSKYFNGWQIGLVTMGMLLFFPAAQAVVPSDAIGTLKTTVIDYATKNSLYVGGTGAVVAGLIVAFAGEVKKVVMNQFGYICYGVFAPVVAGGVLTAAGATI